MSAPGHDVVVVGGGPAGLSAATWAARYRRRVLVLDSEEHRNRWVEQSHGYLGSDRINPSMLVARARDDLAHYPDAALRRPVRAVGVRREEDGSFTVDTDDGTSISALKLILATGVRDAFPEVDGFFEHYGASVFHCPTCDGYETQGKKVVAFGWSENVAGFAMGLLDWAESITIITDGRAFEGEDVHREALGRHGIELLEDDAVAFTGTRGDLRSVLLRGGREIPCDLGFFSIAHIQRSELAEQLGCALDETNGCVLVDDNCETSIPGVYACGDLTPGMQLVQVAAAKGAIAGVSAAQSLRGSSGGTLSPTPAPDPEAELSPG